MKLARVFLALTVLLQLCSCQGVTPPLTTSASSTPEIAALPTEEPSQPPVPENTAQMVDSFGEKVLASQNGDYQVQLKPAGENLDISLIKTGRLGEPGFSSGAVSGPTDFQGRILKDLDLHPEFREPLLVVLRTATGTNPPPELKLTPGQLKVANELLSTLESPASED